MIKAVTTASSGNKIASRAPFLIAIRLSIVDAVSPGGLVA
jgi:hypothetical protein